jgi:hypothetical protein
MSSIRTREEKERLVLDLYNQGKTIREIAKEVKMSFRDIGVILNKAVEEKAEELKEQHEEIQQLSVSSQAYKLFSEHKTPLEVAIALNLRESEATKFYKEYWKLKQLHNLNMVYEEVEGDLDPFLKLHKLSKAKGMGVKQVVDLLQIANNDLPAVEKRFKRLSNDVSTLQFRKHIDERNLYQLNNQIATTTNILNSLRMSCIRQRREIEKLYNEIKQTAEEKVKDVLTNSKLLLKFAIFSVIESLRSSPELYNFVIHGNSNNTPISYGSNYPSLMLLGRQRQQQSFNDTYTALILEESEKLYNKLTTELTNRVITAAATISESSLSLPTYNDNRN